MALSQTGATGQYSKGPLFGDLRAAIESLNLKHGMNIQPLRRLRSPFVINVMEKALNGAGSRPSAWEGIYHSLCPRCRSGKIFSTSIFRIFPKMNERCPVCGLKFEREQGYFLGAMYFSYLLATVIISVFAVLVWATLGWGLPECVGAGFLLFIPSASVLTFFSRVLWIYMDQSIDPDQSLS